MDQVKKINLIILVIVILLLINYKSVNKIYETILNQLGIKTINFNKKRYKKRIDWTKIIYIIPFVILYYYDYTLNLWSDRIGLSDIISRDLLVYLSKLFGVLGLIMIHANDVGIKMGINQKNIIRLPIFQNLILFGVAYAFTQARSTAIISLFLFHIMKYNISDNITKPKSSKYFKKKYDKLKNKYRKLKCNNN